MRKIILASFILVFLCMIVLISVSQSSTYDAREKALSNEAFLADKGPKSKTSSMFILSFPVGLKVYLIPTNELGRNFSEFVTMTAEERYIGTTPLEVTLKPGTYRIVVGNKDNPIAGRFDGEISTIEILNNTGKLVPSFKVYSFTKEAIHAGILISLFWPLQQTLAEFVSTLPSKDLFTPTDTSVASFKDQLEEHKVPQKDWELLVRMFNRTGKLVWHGAEPTDYLISQWIGIDEYGKPKWLVSEPVLEFQ